MKAIEILIKLDGSAILPGLVMIRAGRELCAHLNEINDPWSLIEGHLSCNHLYLVLSKSLIKDFENGELISYAASLRWFAREFICIEIED